MPVKKVDIQFNKENSYYKLNNDNYTRLIDILSVPHKSIQKVLNLDENKDLLDWVITVTSKLDCGDFNIKTRLHWIVNDLHDFPTCLNCGCIITRDIDYNYATPQYCSVECQRHSKIRLQNAISTIEKRYGDSHYNNRQQARETCMIKYGALNNMQSEKGMQEYRQSMQDKYGVNYTFEIKQVWEKANNTFFEKYGAIRASQCEEVKEKQAKTNNEKYGCKCALQNDCIHVKSINTMQEKYGCTHPSQSPEIIKKSKGKYLYNYIYFDSSPEIAYYIWLVDNNIKFEYKPKDKSIQYVDKYNKQHKYFPDFYLIDSNKLVEIKGDNHFKNGKLINISNNDLNYIAEAKQQCMIENNVEIYTSKDYNIYLKYIRKQYGKDYLKQFKYREKDK